jgi:glycogen debranching enzyme
MNSSCKVAVAAVLFSLCAGVQAQMPSFPLTQTGLVNTGLVISRPVQPPQPFTVAGESGVLVGTQDGQFESWILPIKLISHLTMEANIEGYSVPIAVNPQAANIEVRPDHTVITYSHPGFTIRQIMFSADGATQAGSREASAPRSGPVVLFQIDSMHPLDLVFRFTPEMRWMWPRRNDGVPSPEWVPNQPPTPSNVAEPGQPDGPGMYVLHLDYPDLAGAITIPTATPGILAPYQERPQVHPLELKLHYDPKRDGQGAAAKYFPLLMAVATSKEAATTAALRGAMERLNDGIPAAYKAHAEAYEKLEAETTSIETPDKALNEAFKWGVVSIEQLKAREYTTGQTGLVAGYYASGDSARPGFGWFFGRDALYTLYAVNSYGNFALTRTELEFLMARQRGDGKIMHEFSQTAGDASVDWKSFSYMYAAADATPLFLMAVRDYLRASGDVDFLRAHREAIEKAWAFETAASSDTDHDGIYDNSQGTGWVESWPGRMPHQEVYLALLDEQASEAYAALEGALGDSAKAGEASGRAKAVGAKIEEEYYDAGKGCYAFSHNPDGDPNGVMDKATTVYPAVAWWDYNSAGSRVAHPEKCLEQWAGPTLDTDWGLRDVANTEPFYDGLSYHQGSVWPLFTGWAALAEYRAGQPLAGEQMLMQNVDLTWAQDPGAVTELLSGDFFVPFGRSTSHQLWSSAMVITPTLRGLFGILVDAGTNTITVNPHLPAEWNLADIQNLRVGSRLVWLRFQREGGVIRVIAQTNSNPSNSTAIALRSDQPNANLSGGQASGVSELDIPLPAIEVAIKHHMLPNPGERTSQVKILSTNYGANSLTISLQGVPEARSTLNLYCSKMLPSLKVDNKISSTSAEILRYLDDGPFGPKMPAALVVHFPKGEGWQTTQVTLTW